MAKLNADRIIRVHVVDDHPVVRSGLCSILGECPKLLVAGEAADAVGALNDIPTIQPDVALVDVRLPDLDGLELCRRLKSLPQPPQVLMLTSFGETDNVMAAVGAGADGFVLKTSQVDVLVAAITTVAAGGTVWPAPTLRTIREQGAGEQTSNKLRLLSPQERRVLALIAQGKTNKEIGGAHGVSEKTVRNQVSHLMRKLSVERRAHAAAYYVRFGDNTPAG